MFSLASVKSVYPASTGEDTNFATRVKKTCLVRKGVFLDSREYERSSGLSPDLFFGNV